MPGAPLPAHAAVRVLDDLPPGPACRAYNAGLAAAIGDTVVILDGDCMLAPDWLSRTQRRHEEGWDAVAGGVDVPPGAYWATAYNYSGFSEWLSSRPSGPRAALPTMNLSLRRSVAQTAGPVREDLPRVYDFEWTLRMTRGGARLFFDAEARASHAPPGVTPGLLWRTWYANGSCSQAIRREYRELIYYPRLFDHPGLVRLLAPAIATASTARVLGRDPGAPRLWSVAPMVWLTRLAWCLGASDGRRRGPMTIADYRYRVWPTKPDEADDTST